MGNTRARTTPCPASYQGGVALAPHDFFVDRPRPGRVHGLALELAIALPQGEITEYRLAWQRIEIVGLVQCGTRVAEPFFHRDVRDPAGNGDLRGAAHLLDRTARKDAQRPDRLDRFDPPLGRPGDGSEREGAQQAGRARNG
jgi:hypothetical protein